MAATPERLRFKRSFGQANHYLVTLIVGLQTVKACGALPPNLPAAWNPKDRVRSADRSESFAIKGAVVFLVTAIDEYLGATARLPGATYPSLATALAAAAENENGLRGKLHAFADFSGARRTAELALVESSIVWRNRLVHPGSNARFTGDLRAELMDHAQEFNDDYRHLDPGLMINRFEAGEDSPSLKEIAGMIAATHRVIRAVDSAVLLNLDYGEYMEFVLRSHLADVPREKAHERANRIWGRTEERARKAIVALARQNGFTDAVEDRSHGLTTPMVARLARFSSREALATFGPS